MATAKPWYTRKASKLAARNWEDMKDQWETDLMNALAVNCDEHGQLVELPSLQSAVVDAEDKQHQISRVAEIKGVRLALLGDALGHLRKSLNVYANASLASSNGHCSWSIFNAYQSSFFAAKALLGLLGIGVFESGRPWFLDVFAGRRRLSKPERANGIIPLHEVCLIGAQNVRNIEHRPIWYLLIHVLKKTDLKNQLSVALMTELVELSESDFAKQRNSMLYKVFSWPFSSDLNAPNKQAGFAQLSPDLESGRILEPSNLDFNNHVAVVLIQMVIRLLEELQSIGGIVSLEIGEFKKALALPHNTQLITFMDHNVFKSDQAARLND